MYTAVIPDKNKDNYDIKNVYSNKVSKSGSFRIMFGDLMSVCPWIVDDMKTVKPTRCYTMVY
jgi:hypothetical protein